MADTAASGLNKGKDDIPAGGGTALEDQLRQPGKRVVGTKQVLRAVRDGRAVRVFVSRDADDFIYRQVQAACDEHQVPVTAVDTMEKLGKLCLVGVPTAAAALLS